MDCSPEKRNSDELDHIDTKGMKKCSQCRGSGYVYVLFVGSDGKGCQVRRECPLCEGQRKIYWIEEIVGR